MLAMRLVHKSLPVIVASTVLSCDFAITGTAVLDNKYPPSATPLVVYRAAFETATFGDPVPPGSSSTPQRTEPTSGDNCYVLLAPGWTPTTSPAPTSFVIMKSVQTFGVGAGEVVHIPIDDSSFIGNCATGRVLPQEEATVIAKSFFRDLLAGVEYNAATCTITPVSDPPSR